MFDELNRLTSDFETWEELNEYVGMKRSEPYDEYFEPMKIAESQKKRRITFAERLEDNLIYLLAFLFYTRIGRTEDLVLSQVIADVQSGYINAYGTPDEYVEQHVKRFTDETVAATERNADDPYFFSTDRARFIAENEANIVMNHREYEAAKAGYTKKQWITIVDGKERRTHREVAGMTVPIGDLFYVGDSMFLYPKDLTFDPSPEEVVNCRCSVRYIK